MNNSFAALNDNRLHGIGLGPDLEPAAPVVSDSGSGGFLDKLTDVFNTGVSIFKQIQPSIRQVQQTIQNPTGTMYTQVPPPPAPGMSKGMKLAIGAGLAAVAGLAIYGATRKGGLFGVPEETIDTTAEVVDTKAVLNGPKRKSRKRKK